MFPRLLLLFILVPVIELVLFIQIGERIGMGATLGVILLTAVIGASLARQQGRRTLARFQQAMAEGRMPQDEAIDGLLILLAGAVLVTPGFLTDAVGFALLIPPARSVARKFLAGFVARNINIRGPGTAPAGTPAPEAPSRSRHRDEKIIDAEVIDD